MSGGQLATLAAREGLITEPAAESVRGVTVLRNLTAYGRADHIDEAKARDYISLVELALKGRHTNPGDD